MLEVLNRKGTDCPIKPITCQEGFCQDCAIYEEQKMTKWEDTVMSNKQIISLLSHNGYPPPKHWDEIDLTRKAQAEYAFKAGQRTGGDWMAGLDEGAMRGIKLVVEWININVIGNEDGYIFNDESLTLNHEKWQAQLKTWGV